MKICLLTENYYRGGLDTFIINLINHWPKNDDEFTLICNSSHPGLADIKKKLNKKIKFIKYNFFFSSALTNGFSKYYVFRLLPFRVFFRVLNKILDFPILFFLYIWFFNNFFQKYSFDKFLSINGGYPASLICRTSVISWNKRYGNKNCFFLFHSRAMKVKGNFRMIEKYIDKKVYGSSKILITVSRNCLNSLSERSPYLPKKKLHFIYNGVNDEFDKYKNVKKENFFIMLSTYTSIKGYDLLINIGKILKTKKINFLIKIYGYGKNHEYKNLKNKINNNNLHDIIKLNPFTTEAIFELKKSLGLICLSQSQEAFGLTLIEAMSQGVPILTTNVGGLKEVFNDSNAGYIYDKNDVNGFVDGILELSKDKIKRQYFEKNARDHYLKHFNSVKMSKKYYEIINQTNQ